MSGVVETSDNVGVVTVSGQQLSVLMLVRSLRDSGMDALVAQIAAIGRLAGCRVETSGRYPGWTPDLPRHCCSLDWRYIAANSGRKLPSR